MQTARPTLRLTNLRARLLQRLALEVVTLQELPFFLRQLLNRCFDPRLQLLELQPLVCRQVLICATASLAVATAEARREHHGEPGDRVGEVSNIIVRAGDVVASTRLPVRKISKIGRSTLRHVRLARISTPKYSHLSQPIEDGTLDSVVGKGEEVSADFCIEAIRGFQQAHLAIGDELVELQLGAELLPHRRRERTDVGSVFLENLLSVLAESHARAQPFDQSRSRS